MNKTDYRHMRALGLDYCEANAILARKCYDPVESLKAFRIIEQLNVLLKGMLDLLEKTDHAN